MYFFTLHHLSFISVPYPKVLITKSCWSLGATVKWFESYFSQCYQKVWLFISFTPCSIQCPARVHSMIPPVRYLYCSLCKSLITYMFEQLGACRPLWPPIFKTYFCTQLAMRIQCTCVRPVGGHLNYTIFLNLKTESKNKISRIVLTF